MQALLGLGWTRIPSLDRWPPRYGEEHSIVWPPAGQASGRAERNKRLFRTVLDEIDESGFHIVYIDEAAYFTATPPDGLGLRGLLIEYWKDARSNHVSLFAGTQRPVDVPRPMWSEPSWLFLFRPHDREDLKTIADRSGFRETVLEVLPDLPRHDFLMLHRNTREMAISRVEL
jgi:hypothetical protein